MKNILLATCLLTSIVSFAQAGKSVKKWVHPKPIKDSIWIEFKCDTLYGTIEISIGQGIIKSEGIATTCRQWDWQKPVYSAKDQAAIDSFQKDQIEKFNAGETSGVTWISGSSNMWGSSNYPVMRSAYIKTKDGYKYVEGEFVFKPY